MVKKASLNEELFLVLLLKGEVLDYAKYVQKIIAKHYNIYEDGIYPELHITLDRIKKQRFKDAVNIMEKVIKESQYKGLKVELNKFVCYRQQEDNFLVLKIKDTPSLVDFANSLHSSLIKRDISVISDYQKWEFHITILSNIFANNPITDLDFESLCFFMEGKEQNLYSYSDRLEIWSPTIDPTKKCLASFQL